MSEEEKKLLEQQLWSIANALRGKLDRLLENINDQLRHKA